MKSKIILLLVILIFSGCNNRLSEESCEILLNPFKQTDCYARLAVQENDLQICKLAPYTDCEEYFAGAKAVEHGDINYCDVVGKTDDYVNGGFRGFPDYCRIYFAVVKKDDSYCNVLGDFEQQRCLREVAVERGDIESCNKISHSGQKSVCILEIVKKEINYDYCEDERCYERIAESVLFDAISYKNIDLCNDLKTYDGFFEIKNPDSDIVPSKLCKEFVKSECIGLKEEECKLNLQCEPMYGEIVCNEEEGGECAPPEFIGCSDKKLQYNITYLRFPRYLEIS